MSSVSLDTRSSRAGASGDSARQLPRQRHERSLERVEPASDPGAGAGRAPVDHEAQQDSRRARCAALRRTRDVTASAPAARSGHEAQSSPFVTAPAALPRDSRGARRALPCRRAGRESSAGAGCRRPSSRCSAPARRAPASPTSSRPRRCAARRRTATSLGAAARACARAARASDACSPCRPCRRSGARRDRRSSRRAARRSDRAPRPPWARSSRRSRTPARARASPFANRACACRRAYGASTRLSSTPSHPSSRARANSFLAAALPQRTDSPRRTIAPRRAGDARLERLAALRERQRRERPVAVGEEIERDERRRRRRGVACDRLLGLGVHATLQRLEAERAPSSIERDDLAIEHQRAAVGGELSSARRRSRGTVAPCRCRSASRAARRARRRPR